MEVQSDFKELLALLNKHKVAYIIVGGYALAFHGAPRYTGDIDIFVKADAGNGRSDFIRNKKATGRYRDLADLEALGVNPQDEGAAK